MPIGTFTPPLAKALHNFFFQFFFIYFFYFRCILLQISHQKWFFISISIPGRSGVNINIGRKRIVFTSERYVCYNQIYLH